MLVFVFRRIYKVDMHSVFYVLIDLWAFQFLDVGLFEYQILLIIVKVSSVISLARLLECKCVTRS